jgi:hypothetical protein
VKTTRWQVLALTAALLGPGAARADYLTYEFTGTVTTAVDYSAGHTLLPTSIQPGSTFSGTFSFDNSAPGQVSGSNGFYRDTPLNLSTTVTIDGQYTFRLTVPTHSDEIDILGPTFEYFKRGPNTATDFNPNTLVSLIDFSAGTNTPVLADAQLTPTNTSIGISNPGAQADYYFIGGTLDSLRPSPAPEPATLVLGLVGVAGAAAHRWCATQKPVQVV